MLEKVGEFEILGELGRGGKGVVYRASHPPTQTEVAIKVMAVAAQASPGSVGRFERECRATARLNHPNIVRVLDLGAHGAHPYMVMELVEGQDLDEVLRAGGPLDPQRSARLGVQIAAALEHAHGQRILHRDLKPANVMLHPTRGALLTDFGLAKVFGAQAGPSLTRSSDLLGSPIYMAPEQAMSQHERVGARTDVYGLGAILYESLTAQPPCWGTSLQEVLTAVVEAVPAAPSTLNRVVSRRLDAIVLKCLAKDPDERYASAAEVGAALETYLDTPDGGSRRAPLALMVLGGVALAVLAVGLGLAATRIGGGGQEPSANPVAPTPPPVDPAPPPTPEPPPSEEPPEGGLVPAPEAPPSPLPLDDMHLLDGTPSRGRLNGYLSRAQAVSALAPNLPRAHVDVARAFLALGDLARSRDAIERALKLDPRAAAAYRVRGMTSMRLEPPQEEAAAADFERALELDPGDWQALRERGVVRVNTGALPDGIADFSASLDLSPSAAVYACRGFAAVQVGRFDAAERDFRAVVEIEPKNANALQNLAELARRRQDWRLASDTLARYLELRPTDAVALQTQVDLLLGLKEYEETIVAARKLEDLSPGQAYAPLRRGAALLELGRSGGAHDVVVDVLEREPKNREALLLLLRTQTALETWGGVVATCDQILALEDPPAAETLAKIRQTRAYALERIR